MPRSRCGSATRCNGSLRCSSRARDGVHRSSQSAMWVTWSIRPPPTVQILVFGSKMKDRSVLASGARAGTASGSVVITTRSLSSTSAQSIHEHVSTSSSTSDTTTWGAAVIPRRPRSRYTAHDPRTLDKLSGVTGTRPSTIASASDTATCETGTRWMEPSPRKRKTTLAHGTVICGVHSSPRGSRSERHLQRRRARTERSKPRLVTPSG